MIGPAARSLNVWCNDERVGTLQEHNDVWRFDYDARWDGFDLSPALPVDKGSHIDGASQRPVQWFFDNLLPEEDARTLMAKDARLNEADVFGLLAYYGKESAGALTLLPEGNVVGQDGDRELSHEALSARIQNLPRVSLSIGASKRMSLAGAQHKLPIIYRDGKLFEPIEGTPSAHILKPDHDQVDMYPHSTMNEFFIMSLAKACGLIVPRVDIIYVPEPVYLVERFDRIKTPAGLQRRHTVDACQMLSLAKTHKYDLCSLEVTNRMIETTRSQAMTRKRLFDWMVFNLVVGNQDDHLKNLSFFAGRNGYELAPHYDLLSTSVYGEPGNHMSHQVHWQYPGVNTLDDIDRSGVVAFAKGIGISERLAEKQIDVIAGKADIASAKLIQSIQDQGRKGSGRAGELRLLRTIQHNLIKEMRGKLKA